MSGPVLTEQQAEEATRRYLAGESSADIANDLGVTSAAIRYHMRRIGRPASSLRAMPVEVCAEDLAWMEHAACGGWLEFTDLTVPKQKQICRTKCKVRTECLNYGLTGPFAIGTNQEGIVFGGLGPSELARLQRSRRRLQAVPG